MYIIYSAVLLGFSLSYCAFWCKNRNFSRNSGNFRNILYLPGRLQYFSVTKSVCGMGWLCLKSCLAIWWAVKFWSFGVEQFPKVLTWTASSVGWALSSHHWGILDLIFFQTGQKAWKGFSRILTVCVSNPWGSNSVFPTVRGRGCLGLGVHFQRVGVESEFERAERSVGLEQPWSKLRWHISFHLCLGFMPCPSVTFCIISSALEWSEGRKHGESSAGATLE